ncbi:MAG: Ig-like domain-containing protein, partial [Gammaproteobacteria bacterium]|nr:Ig-like domain-containing protein [Gammaproteobacteria bacterium]
VSTPMGTPVVINVLDHPAVSIASVTVPSFGAVAIDDGGTPADMTDDFLVYTPVAGYTGPDTFFYMLSDPTGTDMAAVNVDVTSSPVPPSPPNVLGQVAKGLVRGALVQLYRLGPGGDRVGVPIAATTTDDQGRWGLTLPSTRPALLVVASGGRYDDETRSTPSRTIDRDDGDALAAVLPGDENFLVSSIYTNALYLRAQHVAGGSDFEAAYATARADSLAAWGFDISTTETADPASPSPLLPDAGRMHAMALGGAANALDRIVTGLGLAAPDGRSISAIVRDLAECTLDGNDFDGVIEVNVDGVASAITNALDLNLEILRFRNNNFSAYSATPLVTWNAAACVAVDPPADTQPPIVTVDLQRVSDLSPALGGFINDPTAVVKVTIAGTTYDATNNGNYWRLDAGLISPDLVDGVYDVAVQAADAAGNIGTDATTTELVIDSSAPNVTIDSIFTTDTSPALSGTVDDPGATVTININGTDYAAVVAGMNWSLAAGIIAPALSEGAYTVTVTAVDSFSNTAIITSPAAVTVSVNDPPTFTISGDITVDEDFTGARLVTVTPDPVPVDELSQTVTYSLNPAGADFADVTIDSNTGTVFVTALPDQWGSQTFTIIADDGQAFANFASQPFTLTVNPVNNPPAFVVSGDIVENQDFIGLRAVAAIPVPVPPDEAAQIVTYSLSPASVAFANVVLDPATGTVSITAVAAATGTQLFTLTADDGQAENNTASATFTLTVNPPDAGNVTPVITGQDPLSTPEELPLVLALSDISVSDPDDSYPGDFTLSVQPGVNYTVVGTTITPVLNFVGTLSVPVSVNDGVASSELYNVDVSVTAVNDPPVFSLSGNIVESEDFSGSRVVTVTPGPIPGDETLQIVTYSLSPASVGFANVVLDPATGTVTVTAIADQSGSQVFTLTADDGESVNNTASQTFSLSINSNSNPISLGIADVDVIEDAAPVVVDLFAAFDDVEDTDAELIYTVVGNTNAGLFDALPIDGVAGTLTLDFAPDTNGVATLTVRATDTGSDWVEASFGVSVNAQSDLSITTLAPGTATPGIGLTVDFTVVVDNAGPSTATGVTVNMPLPAGYTYESDDSPGEYNPATGNWNPAAITGTATLVLTATVNAVGPYNLTAEIVAANESDPDSTPGNANPAEDDQLSTTTAPLPVTDLSLSMTVDDPIPAPDATVALTVTVENFGPFDATGISVSLPPLPGQLSYEAAVPSAGVFDLVTGVWNGFGVNWSGDPLLPFSATLAVTARVNATVPAATILEPVAQVTGFDQLDPDGTEEDSAAMLVLDDGIDHDWIGGMGPDPTDWHNPANWSSGLVPSPGDNVTIDPTGFDPVLSADVLSLATLEIKSGAQVLLNGFTLSTVGDLDARDGPITGPGLVQI